MNVVLFAWCPTSVLYLSALADARSPPGLVVTGTGTSPGAPLAVACEGLGVELWRRDDPNAADVVARVRDADLLLVAGCGRILGPELCAAPKVGALNFHPSLLPAYRGREPLFWALARGEPRVGITVHRLTDDVDAGPILFQRAIPVPARATSASLAPLVDREGAALLPEILALAAAGALPEGERADQKGSHVPPLRPEHGLLDFTRSAVEIDRLVRAARGEIAAYAFTDGLRVLFVEGEPGDEPPPGALPGRVVAVDGDALVIAAARGTYRARRFVFLDRLHDGPALARTLGLGPGSAFSASPVFGSDDAPAP
jgi:methionyl-tRNA formyltransferase